MLMCSRTDSCSREIMVVLCSLARLRSSSQASRRSTASTSGKRGSSDCSMDDLRAQEVAPEQRQRVDLLRGELHLLVLEQAAHQFGARVFGSSPSVVFLGGSSMRDLISISIAAISR